MSIRFVAWLAALIPSGTRHQGFVTMTNQMKWVLLLCGCCIMAACALKQPEPGAQTALPTAPASDVLYDASSWKALIADSCRHFTDGCNTCTRATSVDSAVCTRKACLQYKKPQCLDNKPTQAVYVCSGSKIFTVFYKEYRSGDQKVALKADQVMLVDAQARTGYSLTRQPSASGSRYSGGGLTFWEQGDQATLEQRGNPLYGACRKR
ncbi:hypothetical protein FT643_05820 [Ketobacter sp. MCCC 1A13808]|nr:hypothetical protein [Ketobacter sp. MCCC 1A13808]